MVFSIILIFSLIINHLKRSWIVALVLLATTVNLVNTSMQSLVNTSGNLSYSNGSNFQLISALESRRLYKGYGSYWDGNINTYLSDDRINLLPVTCLGNETTPFLWLLNTAQFYKYSTKSFYIIDPSYPNPPMCSKKQVIKQFGYPSYTFREGNKTILVYPYDLIQKMGSSTL